MVGNKKIYGVYFIALLNNWELVVIEQLDKIFKSEGYFESIDSQRSL